MGAVPERVRRNKAEGRVSGNIEAMHLNKLFLLLYLIFFKGGGE